MNCEPLTMFSYADISGQLRGQGISDPPPGETAEERRGLDTDQHHVHAVGPIAPSQWGPWATC